MKTIPIQDQNAMSPQQRFNNGLAELVDTARADGVKPFELVGIMALVSDEVIRELQDTKRELARLAKAKKIVPVHALTQPPPWPMT